MSRACVPQPLNGRGFVPTKGGDGGVLPRKRTGWSNNDRAVLAGASLRGTPAWPVFDASLIETADDDDHAHGVHRPEADAAGRVFTSGLEMLVPASQLPFDAEFRRVGRRRRYPAALMVGRPGCRVSIDSMFDRAAMVASHLQGSGIELGWRTRATGTELREMVARSLGLSSRMRDPVRNLLEPRVGHETESEEGKREQAADREASAWLSRRGYRADGRARQDGEETEGVRHAC